jgi:predicted nuclease with TOPRIM domain
MDRTREPGSMDGDRAAREQLEQVQVELRDARAALASVEQDTQREMAALQAQLAEVEARRDAARARLEALRVEKSTLAEQKELLERTLWEQRNEQQLLERGAANRDRYVDWKPDRHVRRWTDQMNSLSEKQALVATIVAAILFGVLAWLGVIGP